MSGTEGGTRTHKPLRTADFENERHVATGRNAAESLTLNGSDRDVSHQLGPLPEAVGPIAVTLEAALARALDAAVGAGRIELVDRILAQLETRQRAADPTPANVVPLRRRGTK